MLIRTYIAHLQSYRVGSTDGGAHDDNWYKWAAGVADDIDPAAKS
ncbi:MAG: hypothetical protein JWR21_2829 [Herminiimonas sp.]|nr:hypothetical protein [Herminiimonas sp.]